MKRISKIAFFVIFLILLFALPGLCEDFSLLEEGSDDNYISASIMSEGWINATNYNVLLSIDACTTDCISNSVLYEKTGTETVGKMVKYCSEYISKDRKSLEITMPVESGKEYILKIMFWDSNVNIKPIGKVINLNIDYLYEADPEPEEDENKKISSYGAEAISVLKGLSLMNDFDDGSFHPGRKITREEFAVIATRILNGEKNTSYLKNYNYFKDVNPESFGAGYINYLKYKNMLSDCDGDLYRPKDFITFEEAVSVLVNILGYRKKAEIYDNPYPVLYIDTAGELGLLQNTNFNFGDTLDREEIAILVYNALDLPLMEPVSYGTNIQYAVPDNYQTVLSKYLKIARVDAIVEKLYFNSDDANKVGLNITAVDDCYYRADNQFEKGEKDFYFEEGIEFQQGYTCVAYIDFNNDDAVIKAIVPKSNNNKTIVISNKQAKYGFVQANKDSGKPEKLGYFKTDSYSDSSTTDVKLEDAFKVYTNNNSAEIAFATFATKFAQGGYKQVTLIDNDNNSKYDYAIVTE